MGMPACEPGPAHPADSTLSSCPLRVHAGHLLPQVRGPLCAGVHREGCEASRSCGHGQRCHWQGECMSAWACCCHCAWLGGDARAWCLQPALAGSAGPKWAPTHQQARWPLAPQVAPAKRAGPKQPESVVKASGHAWAANRVLAVRYGSCPRCLLLTCLPWSRPGPGCLQVGGLPRTITPPEVLSLFWGWQVRPASTYILAATDASPHVEVSAGVCAGLPESAGLGTGFWHAWRRLACKPATAMCPHSSRPPSGRRWSSLKCRSTRHWRLRSATAPPSPPLQACSSCRCSRPARRSGTRP